jgi:predicted DNA-binding ribbon-helix-helix protein
MVTIERSQTGIRIEKRILKVLKGLAEFHDLSVGDLLEGVLLHVFEGRRPSASAR